MSDQYTSLKACISCSEVSEITKLVNWVLIFGKHLENKQKCNNSIYLVIKKYN